MLTTNSTFKYSSKYGCHTIYNKLYSNDHEDNAHDTLNNTHARGAQPDSQAVGTVEDKIGDDQRNQDSRQENSVMDVRLCLS